MLDHISYQLFICQIYLSDMLVTRIIKNFSQKQIINYIFKKQDTFVVWDNELLNFIENRHEKYQVQSNNIDVKLNQIMNMFQKKNVFSFSQKSLKMLSIDLQRFYSFDFSKSNRFDDNDFLQNVMLRLAKTKKIKNIDEDKFRKSNIDYFDFRKFESYDDDDYVIVIDKIYYRNVWLFKNAIKSIAISKNNRLIRINLHRCFQNDVQT